MLYLMKQKIWQVKEMKKNQINDSVFFKIYELLCDQIDIIFNLFIFFIYYICLLICLCDFS